MATRMQQRRGTAAQWTAANPTLAAGEIGFETDTNQFKIGNGSSAWSALSYFKNLDGLDGVGGIVTLNANGMIDIALIPQGVALDAELTQYIEDHNNETTSVHGISDTANLVYVSDLSDTIATEVINRNDAINSAITTEVGDRNDAISDAITTEISNRNQAINDAVDLEVTNRNQAINDAIDLEVTNRDAAIDDAISTEVTDRNTAIGTQIGNHNDDTLDVHGIADTSVLATTSDVSTAQSAAETHADTAVSTHNSDTTDVHGISNTSNLVYTNDSRLSDTRTPTDNTVSEAKIVDGAVTSAKIADGAIVNADINASAAIDWTKLAISSTVSATEIGYVDGVTSSVQGQLNDKLNSSTAASTYAPIASPTFTGTVSGVSKSMVGLGNVDNTSDANKPVSTATQTALDAKLSLSGGTMTGALTLSGAPTQDAHAATKAYVDNVTAGINFHQPVRVATTGNITLSGTQTIDGVSVVAGDRVLVKDQTDQKTNGIYVVASGSWTRATDADNTPSGELAGGDFSLVLEGTVNAGYGYVCSNTSAITIGTTNITYSAFNAAKAVTAGTGLTESTPGTLDVNSSVVQFRVSGVSDTEIGYLDGVTSAIQTQLDAKAPTASPTFTGTVTVAASGVAFTDGTQTKEGVPSRTTILQKSAAYTLGALTERDNMIEVSHTGGTAVDITVPTDATLNFPVGTSIDILRTNTGGVRVVGASGVTVNSTPGAYLRAQWSAATLFKRAANTWVLIGDLATA
jgi:hypothetical protein